ncbi:MAG TPA: hypothetical protein VH333_10320 [Pseudonocardiaceae bacterium]|nr:hypothetical protein [Pseudonocardiaceae bacterium]
MAAQPATRQERQDQRHIAVSRAEARPYRGVRELRGNEHAEQADAEHTGQFDRTTETGDPATSGRMPSDSGQ